jgi:hypothetical protein
MNCKSAQRFLPGYLDGAIAAREHARVRQHVESCDTCRNLLESYRRLVVALARVEPVRPPANLATSIRLSAAKVGSPWQAVRRLWARGVMVLEYSRRRPDGRGGAQRPASESCPACALGESCSISGSRRHRNGRSPGLGSVARRGHTQRTGPSCVLQDSLRPKRRCLSAAARSDHDVFALPSANELRPSPRWWPRGAEFQHRPGSRLRRVGTGPTDSFLYSLWFSAPFRFLDS